MSYEVRAAEKGLGWSRWHTPAGMGQGEIPEIAVLFDRVSDLDIISFVLADYGSMEFRRAK